MSGVRGREEERSEKGQRRKQEMARGGLQETQRERERERVEGGAEGDTRGDK